MGRQSDIDRNEVVKEYGIKFRPYLAKSQWPISLQNLISSVQKLVNQSYDGWREDLHCDKNRPWRTEIQARAENLSQLALQSKRDCRELNEEDWRMRLEPEVFKRFDREVNWYVRPHSPVVCMPVSSADLTVTVTFALDGSGDLLLRLTLHPPRYLIGRTVGQSAIVTVIRMGRYLIS